MNSSSRLNNSNDEKLIFIAIKSNKNQNNERLCGRVGWQMANIIAGGSNKQTMHARMVKKNIIRAEKKPETKRE